MRSSIWVLITDTLTSHAVLTVHKNYLMSTQCVTHTQHRQRQQLSTVPYGISHPHSHNNVLLCLQTHARCCEYPVQHIVCILTHVNGCFVSQSHALNQIGKVQRTLKCEVSVFKFYWKQRTASAMSFSVVPVESFEFSWSNILKIFKAKKSARASNKWAKNERNLNSEN